MVAAQEQMPFPTIPFKIFSKFVADNFSSTVTLSTVLMFLFTVTNNTDLLSLHFCQKNAEGEGERATSATGWIRHLGLAVNHRMKEDGCHLLKRSEIASDAGEEKVAIALGMKLESASKLLELYPCNKSGKFRGNLKAVSHHSIKPVFMICPNVAVCQTVACNKCALYQWTRSRDIPHVRLIKDFNVFSNVPVLSGYCKKCKTISYADHERSPSNADSFERVYLNSAKYIKVGQNLWVDRPFTTAVLSGMYNFHGSASAYAEFWNDGFGKSMEHRVSRRQVWNAFIQESLRYVASASNIDLTMQDGLSIDLVTQEAFEVLGEKGIIRAAEQHACDECTQNYKRNADVISSNDPTAVLGMEEAVLNEIDIVPQVDDRQHAPVKMVVLDGIVMGHTVCHILTIYSKLCSCQ